jgi:N-acylneuraminate cytidylyltransferase
MSDLPKIKALLFMKGHSERVPKKNIKPFCGRPLLHWILETLTLCRYIDEIVLNTDDLEIARLAKEHFEVTIHMRPDYLLTITSNEASQIMAYDLSITEGEHFLQTHSTNPLLKPETVDLAVEKYFDNLEKHDSLFSVTPLQKRFYWQNGQAINHDPLHMIKRIFKKTGSRLGQNPLMFPIDPYESVDIDEPIDFAIAEALMAERLKTAVNK